MSSSENEDSLVQVQRVLDAAPSDPHLFCEGGEAMRFFVYAQLKEKKAPIVELIQRGGGVLVGNNATDCNYIGEPSHEYRFRATVDRVVYSYQWVLDSVVQGRPVTRGSYIINAGRVSNSGSVSSSKKYSAREDETLLLWLREAEGDPATEAFWKAAKRSSVLRGRTWKSMQNRYARKLKYVLEEEEEEEAEEEEDDDDDEGEGEEEEEEEEEEEASGVDPQQRIMATLRESASPRSLPALSVDPGFASRGVVTDARAREVRRSVESLALEAGVKVTVAYHALIVHSGSMQEARKYLSGAPTRSASWTTHEDQLVCKLRESNPGRSRDKLAERRAPAEIQEREAFIHHHHHQPAGALITH